jgi:hypothetical protein
LKVLSVKQPWASLIIEFGKDAENRTWIPKYRGTLVIAASKSPDKDGDVVKYVDRILSKRSLREFKLRWSCNELPLGKIIGIVDWFRCCGPKEWCDSPWADNTVAVSQWLLENPRKLEKPIPAKGRLGLWDPPPEAMRTLRRLANEK